MVPVLTAQPCWRGAARSALSGTTPPPDKLRRHGYVESFHGRMRDELPNETFFMSLAHTRARSRPGCKTTTGRDRARLFTTISRRHLPRNWTSNGLLHLTLRAPPSRPPLRNTTART